MSEGPIKSYRDLRVWQMAMDLAVDVYAVSRSFPKSETFGLASQMQRSAVSVAANIAEGFGRESNGSFSQFLKVAQGSLKELETHILIGSRVNLIDDTSTARLLAAADNIGKMLGSLIRKVTA
ncbi:MAG: four helix bundle protein [Rhizobiaceae bacterium]